MKSSYILEFCLHDGYLDRLVSYKMKCINCRLALCLSFLAKLLLRQACEEKSYGRRIGRAGAALTGFCYAKVRTLALYSKFSHITTDRYLAALSSEHRRSSYLYSTVPRKS